ncbi:hypothetical protein ACHAXT_001246 [Thalassiosira profunda]
MMAHPTSFSPTAAVRASCRLWIDGGKSTASINEAALEKFAAEVTQSILSSNQSLEVTEWDADGWHYTGANYMNGGFDDESHELMRMERVALFILALDAINFCFWPLSATGDGKGDGKNCLEYEHLAIALRKIAEADDATKSADDEDTKSGIFRAATSYGLSPDNLSALMPAKLQSMVQQHLPPSTANEPYELPNIEVRCQLLNELGRGLLEQHDGSALQMIAKAERSADKLTGIILDTFPGFRDYVDTDGWSNGSSSPACDWETAKTSSPSVIHFYKRAQIAVADIWAALGRQASSSAENASDRTHMCNFVDTHLITTFPDYRVPQILRHVNVMQYEPALATSIDGKVELSKGGIDEVAIRAATVVAVEEIVVKVKEEIAAAEENSEASQHRLQKLAEDVSAVTIDWYLWQKGENLDRQGLLEPHHRVRTTFY